MTVCLWDSDTGNLVRTRSRGCTIGGVAFSPDGSMLATTGYTTQLWDTVAGTSLRSLYRGFEFTFRAAFSSDGSLTAVATQHSGVQVWETATGTLIRTLTGQTGHVAAMRGVAFSPDGVLLATAGLDGTVRLWT